MKNILLKGLFVSASIVFMIPSAYATTCTKLTKTLSKGSENSEVLKLQDFLFDKGYLTANPNGYFGEATRKAVLKLQRDAGLKLDGVVGVTTRRNILSGTCLKEELTNSSSVKSERVITIATFQKASESGSYILNLNSTNVPIATYRFKSSSKDDLLLTKLNFRILYVSNNGYNVDQSQGVVASNIKVKIGNTEVPVKVTNNDKGHTLGEVLLNDTIILHKDVTLEAVIYADISSSKDATGGKFVLDSSEYDINYKNIVSKKDILSTQYLTFNWMVPEKKVFNNITRESIVYTNSENNDSCKDPFFISRQMSQQIPSDVTINGSITLSVSASAVEKLKINQTLKYEGHPLFYSVLSIKPQGTGSIVKVTAKPIKMDKGCLDLVNSGRFY